MKKTNSKPIQEPKSIPHKYLDFIGLFICAFGFFYSIWYCQDHKPITTVYEEYAEQTEHFRLSDEYYAHGELRDIDAETFSQLIAEQKSFIVMAHMITCPAETPLHTTTETLVSTDNLVIFGMMDDEFKQTSLHDTVKYLPTAAIYRDGQLVAWLDAESDTDLPAYKSADGLRNWLAQYIELQ